MSDEPQALFLDADDPTQVVLTNGLELLEPEGKQPIFTLDEDGEDEVQAWTGWGDLVPALGMRKWDGHIFVSGATGAGKSFIINKMLLLDAAKRTVFLFTDHKKVDISLAPMIRTHRLKIVRQDPDDSKHWEVSIRFFIQKKKGNIMMFDDCTDEDALTMRDNALRHGRHHNAMVIAVNHKLRDHMATKHLLVNARYVIVFPSANKGTAGGFLRDQMEMSGKEARAIVRQSNRDGRHMIVHMQSPNAVATAQSVIRL